MPHAFSLSPAPRARTPGHGYGLPCRGAQLAPIRAGVRVPETTNEHAAQGMLREQPPRLGSTGTPARGRWTGTSRMRRSPWAIRRPLGALPGRRRSWTTGHIYQIAVDLHTQILRPSALSSSRTAPRPTGPRLPSKMPPAGTSVCPPPCYVSKADALPTPKLWTGTTLALDLTATKPARSAEGDGVKSVIHTQQAGSLGVGGRNGLFQSAIRNPQCFAVCRSQPPIRIPQSAMGKYGCILRRNGVKVSWSPGASDWPKRPRRGGLGCRRN
jgi:hypothetical protein